MKVEIYINMKKEEVEHLWEQLNNLSVETRHLAATLQKESEKLKARYEFLERYKEVIKSYIQKS